MYTYRTFEQLNTYEVKLAPLWKAGLSRSVGQDSRLLAYRVGQRATGFWTLDTANDEYS